MGLAAQTAALCAAVFALLLTGCKTPPQPQDPPSTSPGAELHFISIAAQDISRIDLDYTLIVENPTPMDAAFTMEGWKIIVNDMDIGNEGASLSFPDTFDAEPGIREIPIRLELDIPALIDAGVPVRDDFTVELILNLLHQNVLRAAVPIQARETTTFPYIREPVFTITAIAILKAELVNTRFRVGLKIENPNHFPVDLSAFSYTLYGNGLFWADGTEKDIITVAEKSTLTGNLFLVMNFIDMPRGLLDQIARLEDVNYRFTGEAEIVTGVEYLPKFKSGFDISGYSVVLDN